MASVPGGPIFGGKAEEAPLRQCIYGGPSVLQGEQLVQIAEIALSPRADALRNRERLLASALKLFTSSQGEVTLSAVAAEAGVGIGTLYRHFPTRDALVEAIYRDEVDRLADAAPALLAEMPADRALETWLTRYAGLIATKRGLMDVVRSVFEPGAEAPAYFARAHAGRGHADCWPPPLAPARCAATSRRRMCCWRWRRAHGPLPAKESWQERVRPVLRIIMDGLRYTGS